MQEPIGLEVWTIKPNFMKNGSGKDRTRAHSPLQRPTLKSLSF